jgi:hypothetical protein
MQQEIPPPAIDVQFSGRFALRLPRSLHRQAAYLAELEGISLNQFIVSTVAEKAGAVNFYHELTKRLQTTIAKTAAAPATSPVPQRPPVAYPKRTDMPRGDRGGEQGRSRQQ